MTGLSFRHRFVCFLSVAGPAFGAFLTGRLVTNAVSMVGPHILSQVEGRPITPFTRGYLGLISALDARNFPLARIGDIAAIAIACIGFLLVHRLAADRAQRGVMILALIAWSIQIGFLMATVVALASPFNTR
jgi:hypothetical protein